MRLTDDALEPPSHVDSQHCDIRHELSAASAAEDDEINVGCLYVTLNYCCQRQSTGFIHHSDDPRMLKRTPSLTRNHSYATFIT